MPKRTGKWNSTAAAAPDKSESRRRLWDFLSTLVNPRIAYVAIMPAQFRYEPDELVAHGFRPSRTFFIDKSVAVLARLTAITPPELLPPKENRIAKMLSEAAEILAARSIRLDVAHLDFCGGASSEKLVIRELRTFFRSGVMKPGGVVAITILVGHENRNLMGLIRANAFTTRIQSGQDSVAERNFLSLSLENQGRIRTVVEQTFGREKVTILDSWKYVNDCTGNAMLVVVFKLEEKNHAA